MRRGSILSAFVVAAVVALTTSLDCSPARAAGPGQPTDWKRFFYYPYIYYPHNFQRSQGSYNHLYYRYPQVRRLAGLNAVQAGSREVLSQSLLVRIIWADGTGEDRQDHHQGQDGKSDDHPRIFEKGKEP